MWNQPKCPSANECIKNTWCVYHPDLSSCLHLWLLVRSQEKTTQDTECRITEVHGLFFSIGKFMEDMQGDLEWSLLTEKPRDFLSSIGLRTVASLRGPGLLGNIYGTNNIHVNLAWTFLARSFSQRTVFHEQKEADWILSATSQSEFKGNPCFIIKLVHETQKSRCGRWNLCFL